MRRSIVAGVLVLVAALLPASVGASGLAPRWGLEIAGSVARLTSDVDSPYSLPNDFSPDWGAGVTAEWKLARHWAIASGIRYVRIDEHLRYGLTVSDSSAVTFGAVDDRTHWHLLALPVRVVCTPAAAPVFFDLGGELRYLLAARSRSRATLLGPLITTSSLQRAATAQIFEQVPNGEWYDATDFYRRVDVALSAGAGIGFDLAGHPSRIRLGYTHGLPDLAKSDFVTRRSQTVELGFGWSW